MQEKLTKLEKDLGIEWQEFNLEELFGKSTRGRRLKSSDRIKGKLPFVTAGEANMGISAYIGNDVTIFSKNTITIDMFGSAKYRNYSYGADDHVAVVSTSDLPESAVLFITSAIHKSANAGQFDYSRNFYASDADELTIQLPVNDEKMLAIDYMEQFIGTLKAERVATLKAERVATLKAYLKVTGLEDYHLTAEEQDLLDSFDSFKWGNFKVDDIFEKLNLKNHNPTFDKMRDTSRIPTEEFNLPLVNAKLGSNGIMFYGRSCDFDSSEMTIDVISNGAVATGTVYAQPNRTGVLWDAYLLKPKASNMTKGKLLFQAAALQKSVKSKFGWEDKAVWSKVKNEYITFPIKNNSLPDYELMGHYISVIKKLVIKEVVLFADREIELTSEFSNSH
ncbi:Restriction endonuclease subunit S [Vibrio crassostreae]|nr:Restriction endonuclease subunit S [Vibrio crassostreae]